MNERFEQLKRRAVAEADTSHIDFDNMSHTEIQMLGDIAVEQKFAELIVRECMAMCKTGVGNADYNTGRLHCLENIKEHFGIE
jgi:hypothetical protein